MKRIMIFITAAALTAMFIMPFCAYAAENREIDISTLESSSGQKAAESWPEAGWSEDAVLKLVNYGDAVNLGAIDLTEYKSITVKYGRDNTHSTAENAGLVLSDRPVQNADASLSEDAVIYADLTGKMDHSALNPAVSWKDFQDKEGEITVNIDLSGYKAGSNVWLSAKVLPCGDEHSGAAGDTQAAIGFGVTMIRFNAHDEAPATGDGHAVAIMAALALMAGTAVMRRRSY